jgi:hypothetical protein
MNEVTAADLPSWPECEEAMRTNDATALQRFVYENEPAGPSAEQWRQELAAALSEAGR